MACQKRLGKKTQLPLGTKEPSMWKVEEYVGDDGETGCQSQSQYRLQMDSIPLRATRILAASLGLRFGCSYSRWSRHWKAFPQESRASARRSSPMRSTLQYRIVRVLLAAISGRRAEAAAIPSCRLQSRSGRSLSVRSLHPLLAGERRRNPALNPRAPRSLCPSRPARANSSRALPHSRRRPPPLLLRARPLRRSPWPRRSWATHR